MHQVESLALCSRPLKPSEFLGFAQWGFRYRRILTFAQKHCRHRVVHMSTWPVS